MSKGGKRPAPLEGTLTLFGFPATPIQGEVVVRSRTWRGSRALGFLFGGLVVAPAVGLIPPHAPWAAGALGFGIFLAIRKWREHLTLVSFSSTCPKCGASVSLKAGMAIRTGTSVPCQGCRHDAILKLDMDRI